VTRLRALAAGRHPSVVAVCRWFDYDHLPAPLARTSRLFHDLACDLLEALRVDDPELTTGLHRLLEAKDCAVRATQAALDSSSVPTAALFLDRRPDAPETE
jgi:hypothetical protein